MWTQVDGGASALHPPPSSTMPGALMSTRKHPVMVKDATDDDDNDGGLWTQVQRRRHIPSVSSGSTGQAPATAQGGPGLSTPQREAVDSAAANLSAIEKEHFI